MPAGQYAPFTAWRLGPFLDIASYLVTFTLRITGETYHELVDDAREFTVEGPEHLHSRIKYDLQRRYSEPERQEWESFLQPFERSQLLLGEGYDAIILNEPFGDNIEVLSGGMGMLPAPKQPRRTNASTQAVPSAERFIASSSAFSMTLRYSDALVHQ